MMRVWMVLLVVACGPKSTPSTPTGGSGGGGGGGGGGAPSTSTGNAVNLSCTGTSQVKCQTLPFTFAATYDTPSDCRWSPASNELVWTTGSAASPSSRLGITIANFHGPDTYTLDSDSRYLTLAASVSRSSNECPAGQATSSLHSQKGTCGPCTVVITDPDPQAAYPKQLNAAITCNSLCEEDGWTCGGINLSLSQQCSH